MSSGTHLHAPLPTISPIESTYYDVNDVSLHVVAAGEPEDPLVILLHGFPEFWYEWQEYISTFVDAGYRVLVPDQRGYNRSDKPIGVHSYRISTLSKDIVELIATEASDTAHIVGHDWGAFVGWDLALRHPESVNRLGIINAIPLTVFKQVLRSNLTQLRKSWYMLFCQIPRLSEWYVGRNDYSVLRTTMQGSSNSGTFSEVDFERYRRAWAVEGALTAMLNWYRAGFRASEEPPRELVQAPTQVIWGKNDDFIVPEMATKSLDYCEDGTIEQVSEATHWIPHEYPERVSELLLDHLKS